jgi:hypothetical protein
MQSNKFLQTAKKIVKRDSAVFDTLMEFEKTKKIRSKTRLNFTIDKPAAMNFRKLCRNKGYNMSAKVEQAIKDMIAEDK